MEGVPAQYLGKLVNKEGFRVYVYAPNGNKKLVESWDEYEKHMETGLWFATVDDAKAACSTGAAPKKRPAKASKDSDDELIGEQLIPTGSEKADDKSDDGFLPKVSK